MLKGVRVRLMNGRRVSVSLLDSRRSKSVVACHSTSQLSRNLRSEEDDHAARGRQRLI